MAVIRVSGYPGAGKTTVCQELATKLGYEYFYAGKIFRDLAKQKNLTIEEFYSFLALDPSQEQAVDDYQTKLMATKDNLIVEGRIAPFLPCPFEKINVLLTVEADEGARRLQMRSENKARSIAEIKQRTASRVADEHAHYQSLYNIADHFDPKHYDIVFDTTKSTAEKSVAEVFARITKKLEGSR